MRLFVACLSDKERQFYLTYLLMLLCGAYQRTPFINSHCITWELKFIPPNADMFW